MSLGDSWIHTNSVTALSRMNIHEVVSTLSAGVLAGASGSVIGHPLDSLKVRLQVGKALETIKLDLLTIKQLYRGISVPVLTSGLMQSLSFTTYETFKIMSRRDWKMDHLTSVILGASIAGSVTSVLACPLMLVKLQMQVASESNMWVVVREMYKKRGIPTFYRGYGCMFVLESPGRGVYFGVYEFTKHFITKVIHSINNDSSSSSRSNNNNNVKGDSAVLQVCSNSTRMSAAACGGCVAWASVYPFDVIKSRLHLDIDKKLYRNGMHCAIVSYKEGGFKSFFKGLSYTLLRAGPVAATVLPIYEICKDMLM